MSTVAAYSGGALAVVRRDALIFWSYRLRVVSEAFSTLFSLAMFFYVSRLVNVETFREPGDYYSFVVIGLIVLAVMSSTLVGLPMTIRQELVAGTFERLLVSPLGAVAGIVSMTVFPFLNALILGLLTLVAAAVFFDLSVEWATVPFSVPVAALAAFAFAPFAILVSATVLAAKQAGSAAAFVVSGISLVAGFFFPVALLPDWIQWASEVQPFTPALDLMRHLLVGTPLSEPAGEAVVKLLLFAAVLLPASVIPLRAAIRLGRRRGTIIEY